MSTTQESESSRRARALKAARNGRSNPEGRMPLMEHIRELRNRLLKAVLGVIAGTGVGVLFYHQAFKFIIAPYCNVDIHGKVGCAGNQAHPLIVTGPFDPFFVELKVAFIVGVVISSPIWFYQLWAFIAPGLYKRERRWTFGFVACAVPLFGLGGFFAYLAMGRGLRFLLGLTPGGVEPLISISTYFSFVLSFLFIFGAAFELPLVLVLLNLAGVVRHSFISKHRRMMIFLVFLFAGAATPSPDPLSMLLLAFPCVILVEVAELFVWANDRRRDRREAEEMANDDISRFDTEDSLE